MMEMGANFLGSESRIDLFVVPTATILKTLILVLDM